MGWFPKREADNTVLVENLYFNQPQTIQRVQQGGDRIIKGKRGGTGRGTPKKKLDSENKHGKQKTVWKLLALNAIARGWLNGEKLQ